MGGGALRRDGVVEQILAFEVDEDPGVPLGFRDRLARENGWSRAHAGRVYDEYRRFLVLAATAPHPVTPSDAVDQAWHLHLTYTRSYWDRLCGEVLGVPLHHGPTTGTAADGAHHRSQYRQTLARYLETFGAEPPAVIWPGVGERFREPARWQRIDTRAHVVARRGPLVAAGGAGLVVVGSTAAATRAGSDNSGLVLLALVVAIVAVVVLVVVAGARSATGASPRRRGADGGFFFWGDGGGDGGDGGGHHDSGGGCGADSGGGGGGGDSGCGGGGCGGGGD